MPSMMNTPKKRIPQIILPEDLEKIIIAILNRKKKKRLEFQIDNFVRIRTAYMIYFIYFTGCRPKECYGSKTDYLDLIKKTYYIPASANKQRFQDTIYLPDFLVNKMKVYMELRKKFNVDSEYLFPAVKRGKFNVLERSVLSKLFREAIKDAGLYKVSYIDKQGLNRANFTLYNLRHSYGTLVYSKTKDLRKTATMLRHRDFFCRSTLIYVHTTQFLTSNEILNEIFPQNLIEVS